MIINRIIEELKDSAVVIMAHQSRPGKKDFISLELHAGEIRKLLDRPVKYVDDVFGEKATNAITDLKLGEVLVLNNVRTWELENKQFKDFSEAANLEMIKTLSPLFDYFIADAFGAAHRAQPSIIGWPSLIAGPTTVKEFKYMTKILESPEKPMIMLIGGAKAIDKFKAMKFNFENEKLDYALCSGLTAILIFEAIGVETGEANRGAIVKDLEKAKDDIKETYEKFRDKIILPKDLVIDDNGSRKAIDIDELKDYNAVTGDIGPKTTEEFTEIIMNAKTIIANGPPGIFEKEVFRKGTFDMVKAMAEAAKTNGALSVIGGGEMGTAAEMSGYAQEVSFISTGGGAMLEILSGKDVPMVRALREKKP
ncbi:MAG: phosphoglycerate kinase [Promethearchaeota archaeon]